MTTPPLPQPPNPDPTNPTPGPPPTPGPFPPPGGVTGSPVPGAPANSGAVPPSGGSMPPQGTQPPQWGQPPQTPQQYGQPAPGYGQQPYGQQPPAPMPGGPGGPGGPGQPPPGTWQQSGQWGEPPKKKKTLAIVLGIIALLAVLAIVAMLIIKLMGDDDDDNGDKGSKKGTSKVLDCGNSDAGEKISDTDDLYTFTLPDCMSSDSSAAWTILTPSDPKGDAADDNGSGDDYEDYRNAIAVGIFPVSPEDNEQELDSLEESIRKSISEDDDTKNAKFSRKELGGEEALYITADTKTTDGVEVHQGLYATLLDGDFLILSCRWDDDNKKVMEAACKQVTDTIKFSSSSST